MIDKKVYGFGGIQRDLAFSKRDPKFYYDANNIRTVVADQETMGAVTIEKGTSLIYSLPSDQVIIGNAVIGKYLIVISTGNTDMITRLDIDNSYSAFVLFNGDLNLSVDNLIDTEVNYESENIQKVYFADGRNQLRYINVITDTIYTNASLFDVVPAFNISSPIVESISWGGLHTSGMIQYAYNLIIKHGSQTAISPYSELLPLKKQKSGGEVNEIVGQINHILINNVDTKFDVIRLYAIKYTSYNQAPVISLITEQSIDKTSATFRYIDDGTIIYNLSAEELAFLGGTPIVPKTVSSKYNRLILANIEEKYFDINLDIDQTDSNYFDTRAYRFPILSPNTVIKQSNMSDEIVTMSTQGGKDSMFIDGELIQIEHDCINNYFNSDNTSEYVKGSVIYGPLDSALLDADLQDKSQYIETSNILSRNSKTYLKLKVVYNGTTTVENIYLLNELQANNMVYTITTLLESATYSKNYGANISVNSYDKYGDGNITVPESIISSYIDINTGEAISHVVTATVYDAELSEVTSGDIYVYKRNSDVYGATGGDIELFIDQVSSISENSTLLKSNEIYRIGIEFFNGYGQTSPPHWIVDLKAPFGNVNGLYNTLTVNIKSQQKLINQGVVGWRVLRVERTDADKTILCQGIVNPMMFQYYDSAYAKIHQGLQNSNEAVIASETLAGITLANSQTTKLPSPFMRNKSSINDSDIFTGTITNGGNSTIRIEKIQHGRPIAGRSTEDYNDPRFEIFRDFDADTNKSVSHEETRLFLHYSPEVIFNTVTTGENLKLRATHFVENTTQDTYVWGKQIWQDKQYTAFENKRDGHLNLFNSFQSEVNPLELHQNGKIGGGGFTRIKNGEGDVVEEGFVHHQYQYFRNYNYKGVCNNHTFSILGNPQVIGMGEGNVIYPASGIDAAIKYKINNHLFTVIAERNSSENSDYTQKDLVGVNSVGNRCLPIICSNSGTEYKLEDMISSISSNSLYNNSTIVTEVVRTLENQYGGNTYEARSKNKYIRIGKYTPISTTTVNIENAGDIYVGNFVFSRILPNVTAIISANYLQMTEIVSVPLETSINLNCRNDYSIDGWDSKWQPSFDDYHKYNRVYSQQPIYNSTTANDFLFEPSKYFRNRINTTKVKTSGEIIDSWTDVLLNEELYVDGKFGEIVKLISNKDVVYCFQDKAVSWLQIQPRIQQLTSDGIGVELGTGEVLYNYKYISTLSGTSNRLGIFNSPNFIYYIDIRNKSLNKISGEELIGLTDEAGLHAYMLEQLTDDLTYTNTIAGGFDNVNNEAYFTCPNFTIVYNELIDKFTTFLSVPSKRYIPTYNGFLSTNNGYNLWMHQVGDYGKYYGTIYDSSITFFMNPNVFKESVFNGLNFKAELYSSVDNFTTDGITFNLPVKAIRCWNEYQDTGIVNLQYGTDISQKFRDWNLWIPRPSNNLLDRIRGPWCYVTLYFDNSNNYKRVLHDVVLNYMTK